MGTHARQADWQDRAVAAVRIVMAVGLVTGLAAIGFSLGITLVALLARL